MEYAYTTKLTTPFTEALETVKEALTKEGFGVLTEIDVQATMKKKLDETYDPYVILGACNPPLAHRALSARKDIGLFLPCNVVVYGPDGAVTVSAINPTTAMSVIEDTTLVEVATEAGEKLERVIASLGA